MIAAIQVRRLTGRRTYGSVVRALSVLRPANERAGTIRAGLDPDDVLLMTGFLGRIDPSLAALAHRRGVTSPGAA